MSRKLEEEIKDRLHIKKLDKLVASFGGACISNGHGYTTDAKQNIFVKTNASFHATVMFDGEFESLRQINITKTIRAPKEITVIRNYDNKNTSAIVMEFLDIGHLSAECAKKLGKSLSNLHDYNSKLIRYAERASKWVGKQPPSTKHLQQKMGSKSADEEEQDESDIQFSKHCMKVSVSKKDEEQPLNLDASEYPNRFVPQPNTEPINEFGFNLPTSCGSIPQVNEWTRDWVSFYARHRLDVTIRSILSDHSDRELNELWSNLQLKVDKFFMDFEHRGSRDDEIVPALLHGDLWSGNAAQLNDGSDGIIYDPASFFGHSEYEFGIVRMFGGFPAEFERAYFESMPKKKLFEERNKLYQLFHHLNHWNHFGSGYRSSSLRIMKDLTQG